MGLQRERCPSQQESLQKLHQGGCYWRGGGPRKIPGRGESEWCLWFLGNAIQQCSRKSLGQRAPRGRSLIVCKDWDLSCSHMVLCYQLPADAGYSMVEVCEADGPWMRKNVLLWAMFKMNFDVQSLSHVQLFATPWTEACHASLSITNSRSLLKLISTELVMPSTHLMLCHPVLLLHSIFPSIRVFSNELALDIMWPKYWSLSISPSNEYLRLISFRIDWFNLLVVRGTLKSFLQHHSLNASVLWCSAFFIAQLWNSYTTTGKTVALTMQTVGKVMSLLFNMLSSFVTAFWISDRALSKKILRKRLMAMYSTAKIFKKHILWPST